MRNLRTDYERFHEYGALINERIVFFASEDGTYDEGEYGVDYASSKKLIKNLLFLDSLNQKTITLHYSSCGGDWDRGMAIYDTINNLKSPVKFIGYGMVRSMGTIIIQACKYRYLTKNCDFMIHDGEEGFFGTCKDYEAWAEYSKYARHQMYKIYYDKMKQKKKRVTFEEIENMCSHDFIMTPDEAIKLGLADKVI